MSHTDRGPAAADSGVSGRPPAPPVVVLPSPPAAAPIVEESLASASAVELRSGTPGGHRLRAPVDQAEIRHAARIVRRIEAHLRERVVGQHRLRESLLIGMIAQGHILLESVPGLAKTTAASALAGSMSGDFARIQCTPDLMPADITGSQIYDPRTGSFSTQLGPVHAHVVLLDEINRSSPRTQSAMLEAMQERQTTIGGVSHPLPDPFLVVATQNPIEQDGTSSLPEAQLDRFLIKEVLDYPSHTEEREILHRIDSGVFEQSSEAERVQPGHIAELVGTARRIHIDGAITDYLIRIVQATRDPRRLPPRIAAAIDLGASPRASIALTSVTRAMALLRGRAFVIPEDIKAAAHRVLEHRIILTFEASAAGIEQRHVVDAILAAVPAP